MKPLPPTLREKRRYVVFELISLSEEKFSKKEVEKALTSSLFKTLGLFGVSDSSYWLVKFYEDSQTGIIRVTNEYKDKLIASLNFFTEVNFKKIRVKLLKTTGTLKKANEVIKNKK